MPSYAMLFKNNKAQILKKTIVLIIVYEELVSKISSIHSYMSLICSLGYSKEDKFQHKLTANGKCRY